MYKVVDAGHHVGFHQLGRVACPKGLSGDTRRPPPVSALLIGFVELLWCEPRSTETLSSPPRLRAPHLALSAGALRIPRRQTMRPADRLAAPRPIRARPIHPGARALHEPAKLLLGDPEKMARSRSLTGPPVSSHGSRTLAIFTPASSRARASFTLPAIERPKRSIDHTSRTLKAPRLASIIMRSNDGRRFAALARSS
jgi:hypothetical protein